MRPYGSRGIKSISSGELISKMPRNREKRAILGNIGKGSFFRGTSELIPLLRGPKRTTDIAQCDLKCGLEHKAIGHAEFAFQ